MWKIQLEDREAVQRQEIGGRTEGTRRRREGSGETSGGVGGRGGGGSG